MSTFNGQYIVYDSAKNNAFSPIFEDGLTSWGNPDIMRDRWIIDSNNLLISRMINNDYGYTYYSWNLNASVSHEDIKIRPYQFHLISFTDSIGRPNGMTCNSPLPFFTTYHDSCQCIKSIHIQIPIDSVIKLNMQGTIDSELISMRTKFYAVFRYNNEGYLIANGFEATSLKNSNLSLLIYQKFGQWNYFNDRGDPVKTEIIEIKE
ncbi:MAG TPA: hypothetical protein DIW47_14435 [Bacteroidetes bacterium]|nr:hypothetical protein [Bacteroidota bacterium]